MLYLFYGEDDYTSRQLALVARARHADPIVGDLATQTLDGTTCSWDDVVTACSVLPFLSAAQVVEVRGLLTSASGKGAAGGRTDDRPPAAPTPAPPGKSTRRVPPPAQVATFIGGIPATTVLILTEGALTPTNLHVKALQEARLPDATITYSAPLQSAAVGRWVRERAGGAGITVEGPAVDLLIGAHKSNLWAMETELAKLAAYVGPGGKVTTAIVADLVHSAAEATVFRLLDAITAHRLDLALPLLRTLLDGGAAPEYLMAVLSGRFRDWLLGVGRTPRPPNVSPAWLADSFNALLSADRVLKTGSSDDRLVVMDLLVAVLTERLPSALLEQAFTPVGG